MTYGVGNEQINLRVPVPLGCIGYLLIRGMIYHDFRPTAVVITGYTVLPDGTVETRVRTEGGKIQYWAAESVFPSRRAAEEKIPLYEKMYGGADKIAGGTV